MDPDLRAIILFIVVQFVIAFAALVALASEKSKTFDAINELTRSEHDADESELDRRARLSEIAAAIDQATQSKRERAWLISLAYHESHFARYVDLDWPECKDGRTLRCDRGRAFGLLQAHNMTRLEGRVEQFELGVKRLRSGANYCKEQGFDPEAGAFSLYATGKTCGWSGAKRRVEFARRIVGKL
jgi:hypothetical protein